MRKGNARVNVLANSDIYIYIYDPRFRFKAQPC